MGFIDQELNLDLYKNERYNTFVAKAGFFYSQKSKKSRFFLKKMRMCDKVLFNIYTLKQK